MPLKATLKLIETVMAKADDEEGMAGEDGEDSDGLV
jgi:hypothetical protein